ncbi:MAG: hypothetical protein SF339_08365 [Blastocatellia bacterium]|nr:hypothetical protein [Blastocatellia bacterium]
MRFKISLLAALLPLLVNLNGIPGYGQPREGRLPKKFALPANPIELTRSARPNVYFEAMGRKAGILGHENGTFEAWAFPMKLFHDARMSIRVEGQDNPVDFASNVERIIARPEGTTLVASNQLFTIRAIFFSPIDEAGSIVLLDVDTERPLTITVSFVPDLKPMWPGGLGGQNARWAEELKAFVISESRRKYNGLFGSPAATKGVATPAHQLASGELRFDIRVDPKTARQAWYPLIIAGGINGRPPAIELYQRLAATIAEEHQATFNHYRRLRDEMMSIEGPDRAVNLAFEWAKAALDKGMIENPELGLGLIAGWGATGNGARPGFGWFFGGDAAINSFAMTGYGDFDSVGAAFRFLAKYQRADGKIPHEVSQSAAMIKWFEEFPYAYYHADTTPFYIAAVHNLYRQSGDRKLIEDLWPVLKKAYQFCVENDTDGDGILENSRAGLGASELGSLLNDLHQDIYLGATNLEASGAMRELAELMGDPELRTQAGQRVQSAFRSLNELYWDPQANRYVYALGKNNKQNPEITAWTAAPMMFRQLDEKRVGETLSTLSSSRISTDWGVRMLSNQSPAYDPIAYNNGGVWPFLTGFVAAGEYEYRRAHAGWAHIRQLVNLTFDHALGYQPEILSGEFHRPLDESVPHQLFSSGMVVTPLVRGLLGLRADAANRVMRFAPQLPAGWDTLSIRNYRIGASRINIDIKRTGMTGIRYDFEKSDAEPLKLEFLPALPALTRVVKVVLDGKAIKLGPTTCGALGPDTPCSFETTLRKRSTFELVLKGGVEVDAAAPPAPLGSRTSSLKVLETSTPAANRYAMRLEGVAGQTYTLRVRSGSPILDVLAGIPRGEENGWRLIDILFPSVETDGPGNHYLRRDIEFRLKETGKK